MNASDPYLPLPPMSTLNSERLFPTLTPAQLHRIEAHGRRRATARGDVLVEVGTKLVPMFVVVSGEIQVIRSSDGTETLIVAHRPVSELVIIARKSEVVANLFKPVGHAIVVGVNNSRQFAALHDEYFASIARKQAKRFLKP